MRVRALFTDDSIRAFQQRTADAAVPGRITFDKYVRDREAQLQDSPELVRWITSLEEGTLASAAAPELWSALADQGFVICPVAPPVRGHDAVFSFDLISSSTVQNTWSRSSCGGMAVLLVINRVVPLFTEDRLPLICGGPTI